MINILLIFVFNFIHTILEFGLPDFIIDLFIFSFTISNTPECLSLLGGFLDNMNLNLLEFSPFNVFFI